LKIICIISLLTCNLFAAQQEVVYQQITDVGKKISSIKFNFKQNIINGDDVKISNGEIFYKVQNNFRINYKKPSNIEYISNGSELWILDKSKNQALKKNSKDFLGEQIINFFKFGDVLKQNFIVSDFWQEAKVYGFKFKDLHKEDNVVTVFVDMKTLVPNRIIFDRRDLRFEIDIYKISINVLLVDSLFEFVPNEDMKIVEL
jgi:outer membrane lipoprotein-sorting protein